MASCRGGRQESQRPTPLTGWWRATHEDGVDSVDDEHERKHGHDPVDRLEVRPREPPQSDRKQRTSDHSRVESGLGSSDTAVGGGRLVVQVVLDEVEPETHEGSDHELKEPGEESASASYLKSTG